MNDEQYDDCLLKLGLERAQQLFQAIQSRRKAPGNEKRGTMSSKRPITRSRDLPILSRFQKATPIPHHVDLSCLFKSFRYLTPNPQGIPKFPSPKRPCVPIMSYP